MAIHWFSESSKKIRQLKPKDKLMFNNIIISLGALGIILYTALIIMVGIEYFLDDKMPSILTMIIVPIFLPYHIEMLFKDIKTRKKIQDTSGYRTYLRRLQWWKAFFKNKSIPLKLEIEDEPYMDEILCLKDIPQFSKVAYLHMQMRRRK